jgi:hypothetical protein
MKSLNSTSIKCTWTWIPDWFHVWATILRCKRSLEQYPAELRVKDNLNNFSEIWIRFSINMSHMKKECMWVVTMCFMYLMSVLCNCHPGSRVHAQVCCNIFLDLMKALIWSVVFFSSRLVDFNWRLCNKWCKMVHFGQYILANQVPGWEECAPPTPISHSLVYFQGAMNVSLYSKDGW